MRSGLHAVSDPAKWFAMLAAFVVPIDIREKGRAGQRSPAVSSAAVVPAVVSDGAAFDKTGKSGHEKNPTL